MKGNKLNPGLVLTVLGVVFGDIGTSPLYALKESFHPSHGVHIGESSILGVLSLIFWSLMIVISIKYNLLILRADNNGEGGILALTALVQKAFKATSRGLKGLTMLGLFGTALLYGDGMITPAISVLSAVEGLELVRPQLHPYVIPITVLILIALFAIQRHGTERVGKIFGPVTMVWFLTIGILGALKIIEVPGILAALNPAYALRFFLANGWAAFVVLGSVFLVVTGGEALYSDLGHFGRRPINFAWFSFVLPSLLLNYFGQGALLLQDPSAIKNPFFLLAPDWALVPLVILATVATVIASQALITGVYSITMQAVQLQYLPRQKIDHTSSKEFGQIYVGNMNWLLMVCCIALVVSFGSSTALASAYGIAVTMTMLITTILFYFVSRFIWKWRALQALSVCGTLGFVELCFLGANFTKFIHGGWFTLGIGTLIFILMTTWNRGRKILSLRMVEMMTPISDLIHRVQTERVHRSPGVAIYMSGQPQFVPTTLVMNLRHYSSLHEHIVITTVKTEKVPYVRESDRASVINVVAGFYKVQLRYGFMEIPDVPRDLAKVKLSTGELIPALQATYFLGQEQLLAKAGNGGMALWREKLFSFMTRNSQPASRFFNLPPEQVITVGLMVEL